MKIKAPAKINLFLAVTGRRPDGFHELITLMCPVGLCDRVHLKQGSQQIQIICTHPQVPEDSNNLAYRAATLFFRRLNRSEGVRITLEKQIPVGAGLGGGSSDAAAVLRGLNRIYDFPFSLDQLAETAAAIGADVPFFIYGRAAVARGIGTDLEHDLDLKPYPVVIFMPDISVSTAMVYKNLDLGLTKCQKKLKSFPLNRTVYDAAGFLCNDLESVTIKYHPEISDIKAALLSEGAIDALMSGSGAAVFGLFSDRDQAQAAGRSIQRRHRGTVHVTEMTPDIGSHP